MKRFVLVLALLVPGCVTQEQQAEIDAIRADIQRAAETVTELEPVYRKLDKALEDLVVAFKEHRVPLEEFQHLSALIRAEKERVLEHIDNLKASIDDGRKRLQTLQDQGVPLGKIIGVILLQALTGGLFGVEMFRRKGLEKVRDAVIIGLEKGLAEKPQEEAKPILNAIELTSAAKNVADELHQRVKELTGESNRKAA